MRWRSHKSTGDLRTDQGADQVMKAFLMYRDRDFDPRQLLIRREEDSVQQGDEAGQLQDVLPWNAAALRQDSDWTFCSRRCRGDNFLFEVARSQCCPA